jgi:hypothetical protein
MTQANVYNDLAQFSTFSGSNAAALNLASSRIMRLLFDPDGWEPGPDDMETPFPGLTMEHPPISEASIGSLRYELVDNPSHPLIWGYFTGPRRSESTYWRMMRNDRVWMAYSPVELESLLPSLWAAHGNVLIMGAGMGALAWNVRRKSNVKSVTVVDNDRNVLDILQASGALAGCDVIHADALKLKSDPGAFDAVLVDIWPTFGEGRMKDDMAAIYKNLGGADSGAVFAFWSVEHCFLHWMLDHRLITGESFADEIQRANAGLWREFGEWFGVPMPDWHSQSMATTGKPWLYWCIRALTLGFEQEGWWKAWGLMRGARKAGASQ